MINNFIKILVIILLFSACQSEKIKPEIEAIDPETIPSQESWGTTIDFYKDDFLQAKLKTSHLIDFADEKYKLLDSVKIDFYNSDGKIKSTLTSDFGKSDDKKNELIAWGNVIVTSISDKKLLTEELTWNAKTEKVYSDKFVKIYDGKDIIEGYGFESDKTLDNYTIFKITYFAQSEKSK